MDGPASRDLVKRAQAGSAPALEALYERSAGRLLAYIRLRMGAELRTRLESRDILQATLLKSLEHLPEFEGAHSGSLIAWLAAIAEHEIRDRVDYQQRGRRDAAREVRLETDPSLPALARSALTQAIVTEEAERLEAALETLSPAHREIILLRKYQELPFAEIGRRLGKTDDACRMLLARAMTALTIALVGNPQSSG
ncbi:MAG: sigma-70 family RNA polymerase sigma factor [Acidobacteriota bacterium]